MKTKLEIKLNEYSELNIALNKCSMQLKNLTEEQIKQKEVKRLVEGKINDATFSLEESLTSEDVEKSVLMKELAQKELKATELLNDNLSRQIEILKDEQKSIKSNISQKEHECGKVKFNILLDSFLKNNEDELLELFASYFIAGNGWNLGKMVMDEIWIPNVEKMELKWQEKIRGLRNELEFLNL
jgi:hypothetical protein